MNNRYDIELYNEMIYEVFKQQEEETDFARFLKDALLSSDRTLFQKHTVERKHFDDTWIQVIESYLPSIDKITKNMKSQLKFEEEIIPIEKTKRVNSQSIRFLSTNTKYLKETDENELLPEKMLSNIGEIDYGIYENRFIMTLIAKLKDYVFERLNLIKKSLLANRKVHFNAVSSFEFADAQYRIQIEIQKEEKLKLRKEDEHNQYVYEKTEKLYKYISVLVNSPFYKQISKYKKVIPPILKTQVILKNPDFKNAYFLWLYVEQNNILNFTYQNESYNKKFTNYYKESINYLLMHAVAQTFSNEADFKIPDLYEHNQRKEIPAKVVLNLPSEFTLDDDQQIAVENQMMNQYYLEKIKQQLPKNLLKDINKKGIFKKNLKTALEDSIEIHNSIYESYLNYNADQDVFDKLYEAKDLNKRLEKAYQKQNIASIVRQVKYSDLKKALALETKWNLELKKLNDQLIKEEKEATNLYHQKELSKEKQKLEKELKETLQKEHTKLQSSYQREKEKLIIQRKKLQDKLKIEKQKFKEKEQLRIQKEKEKLKLELLKKKEKEQDKQKTKYDKLTQEITAKNNALLTDFENKVKSIK